MRALFAAAFLSSLPGCASPLTPCAAPTCGAGYECIANRCAPEGSAPVPATARRMVFDPVDFVALGTEDPASPTVTFGADSDSALFLRFSPAWKEEGEVVAAFLLLEPTPGTGVDRRDVPLEVRLAGEDWTRDGRGLGTRPLLVGPTARGIARSSPPSTVRVDVTELARALRGGEKDRGFAIAAARAVDGSMTVSTGVSGRPPRFEVYVARGRDRAAW